MGINLLNNPYANLKNMVIDQFNQIDQLIINLTKSHVHLIPKIVSHLVKSGGKRMRPLLTLACAKLVGCDNPDIIKLATSVEFIHSATLFHDDVIDESALRRGQATANSVWDNKSCILIGDFLLSHAFKLMVECNSIDALKMLADASVIITEAEIWQLDLIGKHDNSEEQYINLVIGKTASLFATSCAIAGVLQNSDPEITQALYSYGLNLGIIFQISDDTLDYNGNVETLGKSIGSDFLEKKITLPLIYLLKTASPTDKQIILDNFNSKVPDVAVILKFFDHYDILSQLLSTLTKYKVAAIEALEILPQNSVKQQLESLLEYIVVRKN